MNIFKDLRSELGKVFLKNMEWSVVIIGTSNKGTDRERGNCSTLALPEPQGSLFLGSDSTQNGQKVS